MAGPSAAVAVLACYLLLPLAQAGSPITPNFAWNITLPATSGMFRFFASGNSSAKWSQTFEGAPQPYAKGQVAVGDGYYNISTTFAGAGSGAVQADAVLRAYGRSVWFNGALTLGNEAYQAFLSPDGNSLPDASPSEPFGSTAGPQLASWSGNAWDYRYWRLGIPSNYTGDLTLRVDSATLETGMELLVDNPTWNDVNITDIHAVDDTGAINAFFNCTSDWNVITSLGGGVSGQQPVAYNATQVLSNYYPNAACIFPLPTNMSYIMFNGTLGPDYLLQQITLSPSPPGASNLVTSNSMIYAVPYNVPNSPMYMAALDPSVQYSVTINSRDPIHATNSGFSGITLWSTKGVNGASSDSSASSATGGVAATPSGNKKDDSNTSTNVTQSSHIGPIVGGVIGGLAVIVLLLGTFLLCRRRRRKQQLNEKEVMNIDAGPNVPEHSVSPFMSSAHHSALGGTGAYHIGPDGKIIQERNSMLAHLPSDQTTHRSLSTQDWDREIIAESDAGGLEAATFQRSMEPERVPPEYNPEWAARPVVPTGFLEPPRVSESASSSSMLSPSPIYVDALHHAKFGGNSPASSATSLSELANQGRNIETAGMPTKLRHDGAFEGTFGGSTVSPTTARSSFHQRPGYGTVGGSSDDKSDWVSYSGGSSSGTGTN